MRVVPMRELKEDPLKLVKIIDGLDREGAIVTRDGKPTAALIHLDEDLIEEFLIERHPTLLREVAEAMREYEEKGGVDHETMKKLVEDGE